MRFTSQIDTSLPIIGIDLGYSSTAKSCGITSTFSDISHELTFGECVDFVMTILQENGPQILIIEAVLSTYHLPNGNPFIRGEFEKGRGWYHGPGVSTFAAAIRLLNLLNEGLPKEIQSIPIIEGFLSYKSKRTTHREDATRLVNEFEKAERFHPHPDSEPIFR